MIKFSKKGFTLIELIVTIAVFLLIMGAAVGIFLSIVKHQRTILEEQEILNQASYALEHMSKALRMAGKDLTGGCLIDDGLGIAYSGNYLLTRPTNGVYNGIKFINQSDNDVCQEFYLDTDGILKEIKYGGKAAALISDKFEIKFIRFGINGGNGSGSSTPLAEINSIQPRITIYLEIQTRIKGEDGDPVSLSKKFQTTVSQRDLNVQQ